MISPSLPPDTLPALVSLHASHWRCQQVFCRSQFFFSARTWLGAAPLSDKCRRLQRRWLADCLTLLYDWGEAQERCLQACLQPDPDWQPYFDAWRENQQLGRDCLVRVGHQCLTDHQTGCAAHAFMPL